MSRADTRRQIEIRNERLLWLYGVATPKERVARQAADVAAWRALGTRAGEAA